MIPAPPPPEAAVDPLLLPLQLPLVLFAAVTIGAAVGLVAGLLIARRHDPARQERRR